MKRLARWLFGQGPSNILTLILGPGFVAYGTGIMIGFRTSLIAVLGLPVWVYAGMFIVTGVLKLIGFIVHWGRFSHTLGVTVASFWSLVILILVPGTAGWVTALPWIMISCIAFFAAIWPEPFYLKHGMTVTLPPDDSTNPDMRAIEYVTPVLSNVVDGANPEHKDS